MRILSLGHRADLESELRRVGADPACWPIFAQKRQNIAIRIARLSPAGANILKQTALACGADCAVHRDAASGRVRRSDAILFANLRQLEWLCERLSVQPECVSRLVPEMEALAGRATRPDLCVKVHGRKLDLAARTFVMGALNVTPDSFYDGGVWLEPARAAARALEMERDGADFIDIGAESTRPGSRPVPAHEQLARLLPVLKLIRKAVRVPISIDTTSARVARLTLAEGADMINDVSGLSFDARMPKVLSHAGVPVVLMHMKGRPRTMQRRPAYRDLMQEITATLADALRRAQDAGVKTEQTILDPGIGFGKRIEHNLEILRRLAELRSPGRPILVGPSRKSFIGTVCGLDPEERLEGTLAACVLAAQSGANIVRVHDVKETVRAVRLADAVAGRRE